MSRGNKAVLASAGLALAISFVWANPASAQITESGSVAGVDDLTPAAVTDLTAVADITGPSVELSWVLSESDFLHLSPTGLDFTTGGTFINVNDVSVYNIWRDDGTGYELIGSVGAGENSYIDESVLSGVSYAYSITVADAVGNESDATVSEPPFIALTADCRTALDADGETLFGFLDGNDVINLFDFFKFADAFGKDPGEEGYDGCADFDENGDIDLDDFFIFADSYARDPVEFLTALGSGVGEFDEAEIPDLDEAEIPDLDEAENPDLLGL